jgi:hypothetical protein
MIGRSRRIIPRGEGKKEVWWEEKEKWGQTEVLVESNSGTIAGFRANSETRRGPFWATASAFAR